MLDLITNLLAAAGGLVIFAGAYYVHQKVRLTRTACVAALVGGFVTYGGVIGSWMNRFAVAAGVACAVGVFIGVCVIVADVKGKKKGADRPALFAFFLVPIFLFAGLTCLTVVTADFRDGLQKTTSNMQNMGN